MGVDRRESFRGKVYLLELGQVRLDSGQNFAPSEGPCSWKGPAGQDLHIYTYITDMLNAQYNALKLM